MSKYNIAIDRLIDEMPPQIKKLRISDNGFPVPKFVQDVNGKPDFRVVNSAFMVNAIRLRLCWICGEPLGRYLAFGAGPMCCVSRTVSEPPASYSCMAFSVKACPFLTQPNRKRNHDGLPEEAENPAGVMIERNPGVTAIWVTESYKVFRAGGGNLIRMGDPVRVEWYARGRSATHAEVMASIDSGLPTLQQIARIEGADAMRELSAQVTRTLKLLPQHEEETTT